MWPFTTNYPESTAKDVDGQTFDYIIVGGGTAACVIASRLSEDPNVSVLLVSRGKIKDDWLFNVPLIAQALMHNAPQAVKLVSEPDEEWSGKEISMLTSHGLGGASRLNGLMYTVGVPADYDRWAELGNNQWAWKDCEPVFRKIENATLLPKNAGRGMNGPLWLRHMPAEFAVDKYWIETAKDMGLPARISHNSIDTPAMGIFTMDTMIDRAGSRLSSNRAYLPRPVVIERRKRLTICTGAAATKLKISDDGSTVLGVHLIDALPTRKTSRQCLVNARKEVIVACGAFFSPQLLMLSGIGPRKELESHNISVVKDLPGVGSNLMDHTSIGVTVEVEQKDSYNNLFRPFFVLWQLLLLFVFKTGLFTSTTTKECIWVRSGAIDDKTMQVRRTDEQGRDNLDARDTRNIPDIELILSNSSLYYEPLKGKGYYGILAVLSQPYTKGRVTLKSEDPLELPRLHHPFIKDERDWAVARKATRFAMHAFERFRTQGYPFEATWQHAPGMKQGSIEGSWRDVTDEEIDEFVKKGAASGLHPSSTCRMAKESDGGVVGQDLKVHGFKNLRVADASAFPTLPSAHPVAAVYMVGERCAEFIKSEHKL